jgi:hypothetical protein
MPDTLVTWQELRQLCKKVRQADLLGNLAWGGEYLLLSAPRAQLSARADDTLPPGRTPYLFAQCSRA